MSSVRFGECSFGINMSIRSRLKSKSGRDKTACLSADMVVVHEPPSAWNATLNLGVEPVQILILISHAILSRLSISRRSYQGKTSTGNFRSSLSLFLVRFRSSCCDKKRGRRVFNIFKWLIELIKFLPRLCERSSLPLW